MVERRDVREKRRTEGERRTAVKRRGQYRISELKVVVPQSKPVGVEVVLLRHILERLTDARAVVALGHMHS